MSQGFVQTPDRLARQLVTDAFNDKEPPKDAHILFPGLGGGAFASAVKWYYEKYGVSLPAMTGVEQDKELLDRYETQIPAEVDVIVGDFLETDPDRIQQVTHVIGNPPYVSINNIPSNKKSEYRDEFRVADGRFDLYLLFIEHSLEFLPEEGMLKFIVPEKYVYVNSASVLRDLLSTRHSVESIEYLSSDVFSDHTAYPTVLTVRKNGQGNETRVERKGETRTVSLPRRGERWAASVRGESNLDSPVKLSDVTKCISAGIVTGCDDVFIWDEPPEQAPSEIVYPSASGEGLPLTPEGSVQVEWVVCPYTETGEIISGDVFEEYVSWAESFREELEDRHCVRNGSDWYEWQWTATVDELLAEKIICQDITEEPSFYLDEGELIPQHSTYFIIPNSGVDVERLHSYLNTEEVAEWVALNAQRAANGYLRVQTSTLEKLPVPTELADSYQMRLEDL